MKLTVLALCAAIQIMKLISGHDGTADLKTNDMFTNDEPYIPQQILNFYQLKKYYISMSYC
jgi:hypothetical protein